MATSAFETAYRQTWIQGFDRTQSLLRGTVTTDFLKKGGSYVFPVADTINKTASTRGVNGLIPTNPLALTQNTATILPWHHIAEVTDFNIFASQGDLMMPMIAQSMAALNKKIDEDIITILNTGTTTMTGGGTATVAMITKARALLGQNKVPNDGNLTLLASPAMINYLMQTTEFTSSDYVDTRGFTDGKPAWGDMRMAYRWMGLTVIEHPDVPGIGTASEFCFLYHKNSVGHAIDKDTTDVSTGFDDKQATSWARCSLFFGTVLLQNTGIIKITHDGSAIVSG